MTRSSTIRISLALSVMLLWGSASFAQAPDDEALKLEEPDFTLISLPTALRLPKFKSAFRVTHRFTRPLGEGDFGDLVGDLFGIDAAPSSVSSTGSVSCPADKSAFTAPATRRLSSSVNTAC